MWDAGEVGVNLYDPAGTLVTSEAFPNVSYFEGTPGEDQGAFFISAAMATYDIVSPQAGHWQVELEAVNVPTGGEINWAVLAVEDSELSATLTPDSNWHRLGDTVNVQALVRESSDLVSPEQATLRVVDPSFNVTELALHDDGNHNDGSAGDGIYGASFTVDEPGSFRIGAEFVGIDNGIDWKRLAGSEIYVSPGTASFGDAFSDETVDMDSNGLADVLRIHVPLSVTTDATYLLSGALVDGNDIELGRISASHALTTGVESIALDFDAEMIWPDAVPGPLAVRELRLVDQDSGTVPVQVDYLEHAYTTGDYNPGGFEHPALALTGTFTDTAIDSDGDGYFDYLQVAIGAYVRTAGNYSWNARLVDPQGQEFGWDSSSGYLTEGENQLYLVFDGQTIFSHCAAGSYALSDLGIYGPGASLSIIDVGTTTTYEHNEFEPTLGTLVCAPIRGPEAGEVGIAHTFSATVSPVETTYPVTFTWQADEQLPVMQTPVSSTTEISFTWMTTGTRSLTLTASNSEGVVTASHRIELYEPLAAGFSGTPLEGIAPLTVEFANDTAGRFVDCTWNFGDGTTAEICDAVSHTYVAPGTYNVSLTVQGPTGEDLLVRNDYVTVYAPAIAGFTATPTWGPFPLAVNFSSSSTGDFDECHWNFGDGTSADGCEDQSHTYMRPGFYTVRLTVHGDGGEATQTRTDYIIVEGSITYLPLVVKQ